MNERQNRTIICSVLYLDVVEYSRKPVAEQMRLRDRFNVLLSDALEGVAHNDRIILDTGDGAAVSFLGDPEDALFMALTLRDSLAEKSPNADNEFRLRFGINLGPVKLVKDFNGRPNIIGDGINVAQRIMSFSQPGQVLVSRSYYEVVSRLSDEYSRLFQYEGSRTDKHVREHQVYAVGAGNAIRARPRSGSRSLGFATRKGKAAIAELLARTAASTVDGLRHRPRVTTAFAIVAILAIAVILRIHRDTPYAGVAVTRNAEVKLAETIGKPETAPPAETGPVIRMESAAPQTGAAPAAAVPGENGRATAEQAPAAPNLPENKKPGSGNFATVKLAVLPWGEVYVDGRKRGVSPPLRSIRVAPGKHEIEIRNSSFPRHVETIDARSGNGVTIKHRFR